MPRESAGWKPARRRTGVSPVWHGSATQLGSKFRTGWKPVLRARTLVDAPPWRPARPLGARGATFRVYPAHRSLVRVCRSRVFVVRRGGETGNRASWVLRGTFLESGRHTFRPWVSHSLSGARPSGVRGVVRSIERRVAPARREGCRAHEREVSGRRPGQR